MHRVHFTSFFLSKRNVNVKGIGNGLRSLNRRDLGYVLALLVVVMIAAWPFLVRGGLPRETDAELHVFRLAELSRLVSGGEFYPRWAPNFYFGYGYPIFNYYAPLAYYLGLPVTLLPGLDAVGGVKFVFVVTFLCGAVGLYGFVSDWWSRRAGLVSAAAYVFAPYLQYVDPHARGDLAEFLSFGIFPLALWSYGRLLRGPTPRRLLAAVLTTALIILAHNLMAMVFFAILCVWVIWQAFAFWQRQRTRSQGVPGTGTLRPFLIGMILPLLLGVGLAAFFWLPVALEQDAVHLSNLIGDGGHFDFRNHFLALHEMLGPTRWLDWGATEPDFALNLGIEQWLLSLLGLVGIATGYARHRVNALFYALAAFVLLFLMTALSETAWELVPMMPFLQFPWRLLGPAAVLLAILAGIGVDALARCASIAPQWGGGDAISDERSLSAFLRSGVFKSFGRWFPALALLVLSLQALPLTMPPPWDEAAWDTSARGVMAIERQGRWLGTTSTADFVPRTVEIMPRPQEVMLEQFLAGNPLDRVNRATLPDDASVEAMALTPLHTRYITTSDVPFLLRLFQFDFPGWQARIDGRVVQAERGRPEGFLIIPVPEGNHVVEMQFVETPARRGAWLVSAVALLGTAMLAGAASKLGWTVPARRDTPDIGGQPGQKSVLRTIAVAATLAVAAFILTQSLSLFHLQSTGWQAIPASHDVFHDLGEQVVLIGFDAPDGFARGDTIEVTLYWKAKQDLAINYQVFLHLLDRDGKPVAQSDKLNPGDFPTSRWPPDKYVRDTHRLTLPQALTDGEYTLSTGLWVQTEGWRLPVLDIQGNQIGDSVQLEQIEIEGQGDARD